MSSIKRGTSRPSDHDRLPDVLKVDSSPVSGPYDERFKTNLTKLLIEKLDSTHLELGNGTQIVQDDASATGMRCARHMGIILGLKTALSLIKQVEEDMSGKKKGD